MNDENVVPITAAEKSSRTPKPPRGERPLYPSPEAPLEVARKLYAKFRTPNGRTLVCHRGEWMRWNGQQWNDWATDHLRSTVYQRLGEVDYDKPVRKGGEIVRHERTRWNPNRNKVANVLEALAAVAHLPADTDAPGWIADHDNSIGPADQVIACTNGLLSLATRDLHQHTPAFYNHVSVPFAYQADAPPPAAWTAFLQSVWPDDSASIALLQEWIGYILTGRTDMQKILLLIGPTRSGKGTVARMLRNLIGRGHVTGPTLASLGTNFGLAPLMGKPLAVIADARLGGTAAHTIVERLLSVSGEDVLTVDRKFRDPWAGKLPTRIMILSNEVPRFSDASGAIANRLLVLQMRNSFLGNEDRTLDTRITTELPGILNWALEGLDRLTHRGHFTTPQASNEATTMLMDLASPVSAFVRDYCTRGTGHSVERDRLYNAWKAWCTDNGHEPGSKVTFGRNLAAAVPDLGNSKPRINGIQIRCYTNIGLPGASPASAVKTAGHSPATEADPPVPPVQPQLPEATLAASPTKTKPQVRADEAGEARQHPLQNATGNLTAREWFANHIAELQTAGHTTTTSLAVMKAGEAAGFTRNNLRQAASAHPDVRTIDRKGGTATWSIEPGRQVPEYTSAAQWLDSWLDRQDASTVQPAEVRIAGESAGHPWHSVRRAAGLSPRIESIPAHGDARTERIWKIVPGSLEAGA